MQVLCSAGVHFHHLGERHWHLPAAVGSQGHLSQGEATLDQILSASPINLVVYPCCIFDPHALKHDSWDDLHHETLAFPVVEHLEHEESPCLLCSFVYFCKLTT